MLNSDILFQQLSSGTLAFPIMEYLLQWNPKSDQDQTVVRQTPCNFKSWFEVKSRFQITIMAGQTLPYFLSPQLSLFLTSILIPTMGNNFIFCIFFFSYFYHLHFFFLYLTLHPRIYLKHVVNAFSIDFIL